MVDQEKLMQLLQEQKRDLLKKCAERKKKAELAAQENNQISENSNPEDSLVHRFLDHDSMRFPGDHESNYKLPDGYHTKDSLLNYIRNKSLR